MQKKRFYQLLRLGSLLYELQPQAVVVHPWKDLLQQRLQSRPHVELGDLLIRQMTLLNRHQRLADRGAYHSEHIDLVMAMNLLSGEYRYNTLLSPRLQMAYSKLRHRLTPGQWFKRKDVERITGYRKTESHRIIKLLEVCDKIERVGGSKQMGYYYQLVE